MTSREPDRVAVFAADLDEKSIELLRVTRPPEEARLFNVELESVEDGQAASLSDP